MESPSPAEQIDHAVSAVLEGRPPRVSAALAGELAAAEALHQRLAPVPVSERFEAHLARRLGRTRRRRQRLLLTAAAGVAFVLPAVGAIAVWRWAHR